VRSENGCATMLPIQPDRAWEEKNGRNSPNKCVPSL
jgi:hypothetical protein